MAALLLLSSLAMVFVIRIMPLILWGRPELSTGDVINHLNLVDGFRQNRHRVPDFKNKFLLTDEEDYPVLLHWMLSFLPQRAVDHYEPVFGAIVETIHGALLFLATYALAHWAWHSSDPASVAFLATLMWASTPLLLGIENYGRVFRLSARPLGVLLGSISLMTEVLFLTTQDYAWLAVGGATAGLVMLTSKFGVQALLFLTSFLCVLSWDARPLLLLPIGFTVGMLLSRGHLLTILRGMIRHSHFYCTYLSSRHPATTSYTFTDLFALPITLFTDPKKVARLFLTHYVIISFSLFPWSVLLLATYAMHPHLVSNDNGMEKYLLCWYLAGLITMLATATPWLQFLGEASRYVIHSVTPVCILAAHRLMWLDDVRLWQLAYILAIVAAAGLICNYWVTAAVRCGDADRMKLYDWMKQQPASTLLTIDLRLSFLLCFRTPHRAVNVHTNAPRGSNLEAYKRLVADAYPSPATDLDGLVGEYRVDLIVVDLKAIEAFQKHSQGKSYDLSPFQLIFESGRFSVYRTQPLPAAHAIPCLITDAA